MYKKTSAEEKIMNEKERKEETEGQKKKYERLKIEILFFPKKKTAITSHEKEKKKN